MAETGAVLRSLFPPVPSRRLPLAEVAQLDDAAGQLVDPDESYLSAAVAQWPASIADRLHEGVKQ
jgi:hypothetical protein